MLRNEEGYTDPTPSTVISEETRKKKLQKRLKRTMKYVRFITDDQGFELVERIVLRDKQTGEILR